MVEAERTATVSTARSPSDVAGEHGQGRGGWSAARAVGSEGTPDTHGLLACDRKHCQTPVSLHLFSSDMVATSTTTLSPSVKGKSTARKHEASDALQAEYFDSGSDDESSSDTTSESDSDSDEEIGQEFLDSLLERARRNAALKTRFDEDGKDNLPTDREEEEILRLDTGGEEDRQYVRRHNLFSHCS